MQVRRVRACIHGDLVRMWTGIQRACVGDLVHVCGDLACARVHGGTVCAWGSSGHSQESVLCMKVWEPTCEAFTMQKLSVEKKGNVTIAYLTACRGIKSVCRDRGWGETE
jgi:hypothetical protein